MNKIRVLMQRYVVCGITDNQRVAERLILAFIESGIDASEISFLLSTQEIPSSDREGSDWSSLKQVIETHKVEPHIHAAEGATAGAATGGILGGAFGLLAGMGMIAIPGIGPLIAAGPLLATLSGIGAGGTLGSLLGILIGTNIPEKDTHHYLLGLKEGGVIITVHVRSEEQADFIMELFEKEGATEVLAIPEKSLGKTEL
jgi:hypothetical protein